LYLLYFPQLSNFFTHLTASADLAEELISDTMFDVWRQSTNIGPDIPVFVWVMRIAYMHALRRLARESTGPNHDRPGPTALEPVPHLQDLLVSLTVEERAVVYLVYSGHRSRQDVVYIMQQSSEYVDMHLTNARLWLRSSGNPDIDSARHLSSWAVV
jgi:DNA-directed RNA polymerase specialized sigma24 family protein